MQKSGFPITDDSKLRETKVKSAEIFTGRVIHVQQWEVLCADGKPAGREIVLHNGASAIVPVDDEGYVTMVRQHRVAVDECTWEIPAGKLDSADEDPFLCAKRELEEETGLRAENWTKLTKVITTPGFCSEQISLFLATGLSQHASHTDADEFLNVARVPLSEALDAVMRGEIRDAKTALGLLMAARLLEKGK